MARSLEVSLRTTFAGEEFGEDIVADLEKEGRRVNEFLGLVWHDEQARFLREKPREAALFADLSGCHPSGL